MMYQFIYTMYWLQVSLHKVFVNGVRLAPVNETGHFIHAVLMDVPEYLKNSDIELVLSTYGAVAHITKEYVEFRGFELENETRHVLFSYVTKELPESLILDGFHVFVNYTPQCKTRTMYGVNDLISKPDNIPKHVMEKVVKTMGNSEVREKSQIQKHQHKATLAAAVTAEKPAACPAAEIASSSSEGSVYMKPNKTLSLANLPQCEEKEDYTMKYDKELETLSLMSGSNSFTGKDITGSGGVYSRGRRTSMEQRYNTGKQKQRGRSVEPAHRFPWDETDPVTRL
jgi:hypothetical protein